MRCLVAVLVAILLAPVAALAQGTAVVTANAPIYIGPAVSPTPLRVAAPRTVLKVLQQQEEWVQVEFADPQWGPRIGWVQRALLTIRDPALEPMDLSVTEDAAGQPRPDASRPPAPPSPSAETPRDVAGHSQARRGAWFSVGMGFGTLGCQDCLVRDNGLSGGLSVGGTLGDRVLLGVGTTGWAGNLDGELFTVGTLDARVRVYPARRAGFFLTGGVGVGSIHYAGESEFGLGVVLGVGWDIRVGRNVSLTPFWNGFAMANSVVDANVGQIGLGLTIH